MDKKFFIQALKYGIVGVANTLITALTIWIMMRWVFRVKGEEDVSSLVVSISNVIGFIAGLLNSFIWNRNWTFKSQKNWKIDFLKFMLAFIVCFIPQLLLVVLLNKYAAIPSFKFHWMQNEYLITSAYICQLIGIVFYTTLNFLCNKYYAFKK